MTTHTELDTRNYRDVTPALPGSAGKALHAVSANINRVHGSTPYVELQAWDQHNGNVIFVKMTIAQAEMLRATLSCVASRA